MYFFLKRNIHTCKFTYKLNCTGYLQIVTLLFRLPYAACIVIKFGSLGRNVLSPHSMQFICRKDCTDPMLQKKSYCIKAFFGLFTYIPSAQLCAQNIHCTPFHYFLMTSFQSKGIIANELISRLLLMKWFNPQNFR